MFTFFATVIPVAIVVYIVAMIHPVAGRVARVIGFGVTAAVVGDVMPRSRSEAIWYGGHGHNDWMYDRYYAPDRRRGRDYDRGGY